MKSDRDYLTETIKLAEKNLASVNGGPFAALVVKNGAIISTAVNSVTSSNDPTAHAEINAIREACKVLKTFKLDDCILYSSCEPCPMCLGAVYWAGIQRIVFSADRNDAATGGFIDSELYNEMNKDLKSRKIPTEQIELKAAKELFKKWNQTENKINY